MSESNLEITPNDSNVFQSAEQLCAVKGISKHVIKLAKARKAPGFVGSRIYWDNFEPWYNENKAELEEYASETWEQYKKELVKWQSEKARLEVQELRGNQLDKEAVKSFLRSYNAAARALVSDLPDNYAAKFIGLTSEQAHQKLEQLREDICILFTDRLTDDWVRKFNNKA